MLVRWTGEIGSASLKEACREVDNATAYNGEGFPRLLITSGGGLIYEAQSFYTQYKDRIDTIACANVSSAAILIFLAGRKESRCIMKETTILLHEILPGSAGRNIEENRANSERLERGNKTYIKILSERTNLSVKQVEDFMKKCRWLTPGEAIKYGFATKIIGSRDLARFTKPIKKD